MYKSYLFIPMACLALCCLRCLRCRYANNWKKRHERKKITINQSRTFFQPRTMMHRCDVTSAVSSRNLVWPHTWVIGSLKIKKRMHVRKKLSTFKYYFTFYLFSAPIKAFCLPLLVLASRSPPLRQCGPPRHRRLSLPRSTTAGSSVSSDSPSPP